MEVLCRQILVDISDFQFGTSFLDGICKFHTGNGLYFTFDSYRKAGGGAEDDRPYKKVAMKGMMIKYTHLSISNKIQIVF